jgi:hypothetical protein
MDAIREIQQYAKEIIALFALISGAIFGTKHFFRWRISHEGGAYNRAAFFEAVANGEIQLVRWFLWAGINPKRLHKAPPRSFARWKNNISTSSGCSFRGAGSTSGEDGSIRIRPAATV